MSDLSDLKRGMIIGARLAGASVSRTANLVGVSRTTVSRTLSAYTKLGKVSSAKHNSGRKSKLSDRDRRVLKRIVARKRKTTLPVITSEMNTHLQNPVSMKTIQRELHAANIHGRVAIPKPLVSARNALKRLQWCQDHLKWTQLQWEQVIWSDESSFTLFQTTGRVFVWRTPAEAFHVDCLVPTVKHGGGSVMVWGAISARGLGPLVVLRGWSKVTITEAFSQIIFTLCFILSFRENVLSSKMTTPLFTRLTVFKHGYMSIMMKWNI